MNWFWWIVLSNLAIAIVRVFQKKQIIAQNGKSGTFSMIYQILSGLLVLTVSISMGYGVPDFSLAPINWGIAIFTFGVSGLLLFKAYEYSDVSNISIIATSRIIWTMVIAILFQGEVLTLPIIVGTSLIVFAVMLIFFKKTGGMDRGAIYAFLAAFAFGIGFANEPYLLEYYAPVQLIAYEMLLVAPVMMLLNPRAAFNLPKVFIKVSKPSILISTTLYGFAAVASLMAYMDSGSLLLITPLSQLGRIFSVTLGIVVLKERKDIPLKILGVTIAVIGALIIKML